MLRRLSVTLFVIGVSIPLTLGLLWAVEGNTASAQERKNCPAGFHWERLSGQCCVQDYETIPGNGKIGYTGNSICEDGYVATYEQRPTTDGKGPPGCPQYTSFAFLTSCIAEGSGAARPGGGAIRDLSEAVYQGGSGPSPEDLATVGGVGVGVIVLTGGTILVLREPRKSAQQILREIQEDRVRLRDPQVTARAWREWRSALEQYERINERVVSLRRRRAELVRDFATVIKEIGRVEGTGGLTATQVLGVLLGLAAGLVTKGAAWIPWAMRILGGGASVSAGLYKGHLKDLRGDLKAELVRIDTDIYAVDDQLDQLKRVHEIAANRVKDTRGRYDVLREMW